LDIAAANYIQTNPNMIFTNNNGDYFERIEYSDLNAHTKKSFQAAWCDINNDLYPDLFFGNDNSVGNEFYVQNENGYFTDQSETSNLVVPAFAMCASFADFDNDSDQDLFISDGQMNQYPLMINNGQGIFTQDMVQPLFFNLEGWGSLWMDADNDGWQDLFICTRGGGIDNQDFNNVFLKNDTGNFTNISIPEITDVPLGYYCNASGDFNNDGKVDMILTAEETGQILILENTSENNNHYIKFKLNGRLSNRNGIGAKYACYFNDMVRTGYLQAGENFLTQNSQNIIIGIGEANFLDSLRIEWPSGITDVYYNIERNTFNILTEAETLPGIAIGNSNCSDQPITVSVAGWSTHVWNNGEISASTTYNPGPIEVEVGTGFGHTILLAGEIPPVINYTVQREVTAPTCPGVQDGQIYYWVNNSENVLIQEWLIDSLGEGLVEVSFPYADGCIYQEVQELAAQSHPTISEVILQNTCPSIEDGSISIIMSGGILPYNQSFGDTIIFDQLAAGIHDVVISDFNQCTVTYQAEILTNTISNIIQHASCADESNGSVVLLYYYDQGKVETFLFDSLMAGSYELLINASDGCPLSWNGTLGYLDTLDIGLDITNTICFGDSVLFDPQINGNISAGNWYFSSPGDWLSAGEHHALFESPSGCLWDTTLYIVNTTLPEITQEITPPINGNPGFILIDVDGSFGPYTIHWEANNSTEWTFPFAGSATYPFVITDAYQCNFEDTAIVIVNEIANNVFEQEWRMEGGQLTYLGAGRNLPIAIYNSAGQMVLSTILKEPTIALPRWSSGMYYLYAPGFTYRLWVHP
jgi:hypothetical protein